MINNQKGQTVIFIEVKERRKRIKMPTSAKNQTINGDKLYSNMTKWK